MNNPHECWEQREPTAPGFYWARLGGEPTIIELFEFEPGALRWILLGSLEIPKAGSLAGSVFWQARLEPPRESGK